MESLRLMPILVVAMLGGGLAVCALLALAVFVVSHTCTRLFKNNDHD
ncbi:hypothetical protein AWB64_03964 [Caballeronia sordidicola]|uniref:Transmembrane protein n=1 Tax=Caballeronia sordidicola TaxID=196367 RepID=A0A158H1L2_CABSO|nr:hypothetical protein [Caballeronia sordidicola]SAL38215.1 hypothetical protein AWB64_03964 [Caballeronia sordidicola]